MRRLHLLSSILGSLALGGCVLIPVYEGRYSSFDGWREGEVLHIGPQLAESPVVFDCRKKLGVAPPDQLYAEVSYRRAPRRRDRQIVPIQKEADLKPGDLVYVKIWDCDAPLPKRLVR